MGEPRTTTGGAGDYFIKPGYTSRDRPDYFADDVTAIRGVVYQPDVYPFAAYLGERFGCTGVIDVGCGTAGKLAGLYPRFKITGVDFGPNLHHCRTAYPFGTWVEWDLDRLGTVPMPEDVLRQSVIVCADVIEHLTAPEHLLDGLKAWMTHAPVCLLSTPERDLARGANDLGPPANPHHVREWTLAELGRLLDAWGFNVQFLGLTASTDRHREKETILAVIERTPAASAGAASVVPHVVAIMTAYNEEDIVVPSVRRLTDQGIGVYFIDNWSTDHTYELVKGLPGLVGVERFPADGPAGRYEWRRMLTRVEELAGTIPADWFIHHDVDEVRLSPWPGVSLRDGLARADRAGFNCVDHVVLTFHPVDDGCPPGTDPGTYFRHYEFGTRADLMVQVKAWKNLGVPVSLAASGGHEACFPGRRVYPYKFLLKHYPIRSQGHGERKVFADRKPRWDADEKECGWHMHYDQIAAGAVFLRDPSGLEVFDERTFSITRLVERLSGIGLASVPHPAGDAAWNEQIVSLARDLEGVIPGGARFALVDEEQVRSALAGLRPLPFPEQGGEYGGPPADAAAAIAECERLRQSGVAYLAFAWPAFWWLDYYEQFRQHLQDHYRQAFQNDRVVVFDLRSEA